jgi:toluene monooxygenase system ferredoxin subunit
MSAAMTTDSPVTDGTWQRVCAEDDVWEGEMSFQILPDGTPVLLVNPDGRIRAFRGMCPHQATSLADADFDGEIIVCPGHLWEFDARSGAGVNPANARLCEWPTATRSGQILIDLTAGHQTKGASQP